MAEKQCSSSGCTKESCEGCPSKNKPTSFQVASNEYTKGETCDRRCQRKRRRR